MELGLDDHDENMIVGFGNGLPFTSYFQSYVVAVIRALYGQAQSFDATHCRRIDQNNIAIDEAVAFLP